MSTPSDEARKIAERILKRNNEDIAAIAHAINEVRVRRGIPFNELESKTKIAVESILNCFYKDNN